MSVQDKLRAAGVKNLKEFGYPSVDKDNILTDGVYRSFFVQMLNDNLGQGFDKDINSLLSTIKENYE